MNKEKYIFRCKTTDAHILKILFKLLHNNIKTACFSITAKGIALCMTDSNRRTLVKLEMLAREFNLFHIEEPIINIGVNVNHMYKLLKSNKKKDSIVLFIREDTPSDLGIQVIPKDHSRVTNSSIRIQNIQNLEIMVPDGYTNHLLVPSSEFCKVCKNMLSMSNTITISAIEDAVRFVCNLGSVYSREEILGENMNDFQSPHFSDDFDTEQLQRIIEITGLSNNLTIHSTKGLPLFIETRIGNLGNISLYIKSRRQLEEEQLHTEM
jgi:proliferating cell nuclear antigen